jgi:tRNA pseudouridine38-40 synthase
MRVRLTIEYTGTRYSGWQVQPNARTIQGTLADAVADVLRTRAFELYGAGRTDAGVHASAQIAHLDTRASLTPEPFRRRVNDALPADIHVLRVDAAHPRFHARRDAVARRYVYQVSRRRTAFGKAYVWWVREPLALDAMREAAARLTGLHDFASFTDRTPDEGSTRVDLQALEVHEDGDLLRIHVLGSHFLWKMVRRLVGVLVEVGRGGLTPDDVAALLESTAPALPARLTAPASGLFLERVFYPGDTTTAPVQLPVSVHAGPRVAARTHEWRGHPKAPTPRVRS